MILPARVTQPTGRKCTLGIIMTGVRKCMCFVCKTAFSYRNAAAVRSCYLDDSSNELSSPVLWCCAVLSSSFESLFSDLAFPSELIRWKVVGGIASINILFAEIKAVFLWWKCILGCFANFHLFHSRALPAPLVSAASPRHNLMSVRVRDSAETNTQLLGSAYSRTLSS